ncbi:MAG: hypothetical protein AB1420_03415 [Bacillota bacterium]
MQDFLKSRLTPVGRVLFVLAALAILISLFFPLWYLNLEATMYPEGLSMEVYANKIGGRIDIINNLNHYIGMKEISEADFPELTFMPYVVGLVALLILLSAGLGRVDIAVVTLGLASVGGMLGIYRLWYWLHLYGTDLDPKAAIKIPPFTPPMIGKNQLANFTTYTGFGIGGYLLILGILLLLIALWRFRECDAK